MFEVDSLSYYLNTFLTQTFANVIVNMSPPSFGILLKKYRLAAGLTQEELAEHAGISTRGISDLERGVRRTPYKHPLRLPWRPVKTGGLY